MDDLILWENVVQRPDLQRAETHELNIGPQGEPEHYRPVWWKPTNPTSDSPASHPQST